MEKEETIRDVVFTIKGQVALLVDGQKRIEEKTDEICASIGTCQVGHAQRLVATEIKIESLEVGKKALVAGIISLLLLILGAVALHAFILK